MPKPARRMEAVAAVSPSSLLGVEHEEGRQRGVAEHPEQLGDEDRAYARAPSDPQVVPQPEGLAVLARHVLRLGDPRQRRQCEERHEDGGEEERRPQRDSGQRAADGQAQQAAAQHRELLRARRLRARLGREELRDERAVRGRHRVQADVDDGAGQRQHEVRARPAERGRAEGAGGEEAAAPDERPGAADAAGAEPIRPDADDERDGEAGGGVHEHDGADEGGRVGDPVEQHRQVGRRDGAAETGARGRAAKATRYGRRRRDPRPASRSKVTATALISRARRSAALRGGSSGRRGRNRGRWCRRSPGSGRP